MRGKRVSPLLCKRVRNGIQVFKVKVELGWGMNNSGLRFETLTAADARRLAAVFDEQLFAKSGLGL